MYHRSALRSALIISLLGLFISQIGIVSAGNNFWTSIGPEGGQIYALVIAPPLPGTPATLYAGTDGGVFKSTNGGGNWSAINTGMVSAAVRSLVIDPLTPTTLYARTDDNVFKSTNSGENWSAVGVAGHNVQALAVDPLMPTTLYAGTGGGSIFKSTDGGLNWSEISLLSGKDYTILVIDPQTPTTLYIKTKNNSGMFKSTNSGESWNAIGTGQIEYVQYLLIAPRLPGVDPVMPATLYTIASGGVFKSTDGGENWSTVNEGLTNTYVQTLAMDPAVPTTLYAATQGGLFKSINGGASWNGINSDQTEISTLVIDPLAPTTFYAGTTYDGIFKSTNSGENWNVVNTGLTATLIKTLVIDPKTPTTLYVATSDGVFKSTNSGGNWRALTGLPTTYIEDLDIDPQTPTTLYVWSAWWTQEYNGLYKSTDGGEHWGFVGTKSYGHTDSLTIDPVTPTTLYMGTNGGGVYKSVDGGENWSGSNTGLRVLYINTLTIVPPVPGVDPVAPTALYAGTWGGVFKSTNGGESWSEVSTGLTNTYIQALAIAPPLPGVDPITSTTLYAGTWDGVFKSTNSGESWHVVNTGLTGINVLSLAVDPLTPSIVYAGLEDNGVFRSTNGGESWRTVNTNLAHSSVQTLAIAPPLPGANPADPTVLYAGTPGLGVFSINITPPGVFAKSSPTHTASGVTTNPGLHWEASSTLDHYEYCVDTSDDNACDGDWISTGMDTSVMLSGLSYDTTYFWQVQAVNPGAATAANGGAWWSFTTDLDPSGGFAKTSPANAAIGVSTLPTLRWGVSSTATGYEYCYDTTPDDACSGTWLSTGTDTSVTLSGLSRDTTYSWQARAISPGGTIYANGGAWWSFTTIVNPPGPFAKIGPANAAGGILIPPTLSWEASSGAANYEYCYDTTPDDACSGTWTSAGANTRVNLSGLNYETTYFWQIRAVNAAGTTAADDGAWWKFTTSIAPPGAFYKISPNYYTETYLNPILQWSASSQAASYEYCVDTSNDNDCSGTWINTGTKTYAALSGLWYNTNYYWQVRAINAGGTLAADGGNWWRFSSTPKKFFPANSATGILLNPTLSWGAVSSTASYEYCVDTSNDNDCSGTWINTGKNTHVTLSGLSYNTIYYWQVRIIDANGTAEADWGVWWSFSSTLRKLSPANSATGMSLNPTLTWGTGDSANSYEYCYDTTNDNACSTAWIYTGTNTSVTLSGLSNNTTYYWQVRTIDTNGTTEADGGVWWNFSSTLTKISPANSATEIPLNPALTWEAYSSATSYEYCYDMMNDNACSATWINTGTNTSVTLSGLNYNTIYYWQVRIIDASRTTDANLGTWWKFTTQAAQPGAFHKITPANTATGAALSQILSWGTSSDATRYEYCYDTTNDNTCSGTWISTGTNTSVTLTGLDYNTTYGLDYNTTYNWQVRAINTNRTTYADDTIWWNFTTSIGSNVWKLYGLKDIGITSMAIDPLTPSIFYVGAGNSVFRTSDNGKNWSQGNIDQIVGAIYSLVVDPLTPTTLYAGTAYRGIFKSTDSGASWNKINTGLSDNHWINILAIDPKTPTTLYAGTYYKGAFKSTDGGRNWSAINTGLGNTFAFITSLVIDRKTPTTIYAGTDSYGIYKSTNGGENWSKINTGMTSTYIYSLAIDPTNPTTLYAGSKSGISKSTNGGGNWIAINSGLTTTDISALVVDPITPTTLYAGTDDKGVFRSVNGGENWSPFNAGLPFLSLWNLAMDPTTPSTLYAATHRGVFSYRLAQPDPFAKSSPIHLSTRVNINPTLTWETSNQASHYEYCYDTINDNACSGGWISTGTNTSINLSGLSSNTTYYWQVRAVNVSGATDATDGTWWSFTPASSKVFMPLLAR